VQQEQLGRFRRFVLTPPGKALLVALALVVVFASDVYVETLVAIPAMLLFGLAVPIWVGLKAPRYLAISGLVILLLVAPVSTLVFTQDVMTPIPASVSGSSLPEGNGSSVLQAALVTPYTGTTSTNFTWNVTIFPQYVPAGNSTPLWLNLYISTCPGATGPSSPNCASSYPFIELNDTGVAGITKETNASFHYTIGSNGIWDWQMSLASRSNATHNLTYIFLVGDPTYNGIEGPVIGGYWVTYESLLLTIYFDDFLFFGAPFYFVLLIYMILKRRERTKADAIKRAAGPTPPDEAGPSLPTSTKPGGGTASPASAAIAGPKEGSCPSCGAVVYAGEKTCWKCGASISAPSAGTPLSGSGSP
jgi:hypothetical protein